MRSDCCNQRIQLAAQLVANQFQFLLFLAQFRGFLGIGLGG
jgi:hypothetical protein